MLGNPMDTQSGRDGEDLFEKIIEQSNQLESLIEAQSWRDAARVEGERYTLLQQLASIQSIRKSSRYEAFLRQAIEFIQAKQPQLEQQLQQSKLKLTEHGHNRASVRKYQDISLT